MSLNAKVSCCSKLLQKTSFSLNLAASIFQPYIDFFTEFAGEILNHMKVQERFRERIQGHAPQIDCRLHLIDLLHKVCLRRQFTRNTLHLAAYLLDLYMEHHNISTATLNMVGIVTLIIAAKFEETECFVPKYTEINSFITLNYRTEGLSLTAALKKQKFITKKIIFSLYRVRTMRTSYAAVLPVGPQCANGRYISALFHRVCNN